MGGPRLWCRLAGAMAAMAIRQTMADVNMEEEAALRALVQPLEVTAEPVQPSVVVGAPTMFTGVSPAGRRRGESGRGSDSFGQESAHGAEVHALEVHLKCTFCRAEYGRSGHWLMSCRRASGAVARASRWVTRMRRPARSRDTTRAPIRLGVSPIRRDGVQGARCLASRRASSRTRGSSR